MKLLLKKIGILVFLSALLLTSCRTEELELINTPDNGVVGVNSTIANLMQNISTNDGSFDNIIDNSNCFNIQLPITVIVNGIEIVVNTEDDFDLIEAIFDEFSNDDDTLIIIFPITIILSDFTVVVINNMDELNTYSIQCNGENEIDDDIECIDFQYPITASLFNLNNELIDTITINNDEELYELLENLDEDIILSINFPITVILYDGTEIVINNLIELENIIVSVMDVCDEDDDNDINDDDCNNCTATQLNDILTQCTDWTVDKLERDDEDLEDIYVGYLFNFAENGTLTVDNGVDSFTGTWESTGTGNDITVTVNIPNLPDFNDAWNLHEIEQLPNETKVDLRIGDDRLRFESDCVSGGGGGGGIDDAALIAALTTGDWYITLFFDDIDETAIYNGYVFNYATDGSATATNSSGPTNGTWSTAAGDETELELNLNFGTTIPLDQLADDWDVLEVTQDIIRLKDVSGNDGSEDFLTFERDPAGTGGSDLNAILSDGLWFVETYLDDGVDETIDYNGYVLNFDTGGTVVADNGTPINGTWDVLNGGNTLLLDFGISIPFDELNDGWDVISATETRVELQDVSGGGGGTDTLIFEKL